MSDAPSQSRGDPEDVHRFQRFLLAVMVLAALFGGVEIIGALLLESPMLIFAGTTTGAIVIPTQVARRFANQGRLGLASVLVGGALLVLVLLNAPVVRFVIPMFLLIPLLAVTIVLPFLHGRSLRLFLALSFGTEVIVAVLGCVLPADETIPAAVRIPLYVGSIAAAYLLIIELLMQFTSRIRKALAQATEAVQARDEFLSMASHELRTPLTPLKLHVEAMLRAQQANPLPSNQLVSRLERIDSQVTRLSRLVNELLDISRITSGRVSIQRSEVDLVTVVQDALKELQDEALRAGSSVSMHADSQSITGQWDDSLLAQVVVNLLSNALKYGAGQPIEVSLTADPRVAVLKVRDYGIGIPPEAQQRIFERFERAVSGHQYGGFGLGLWVVRHVVDGLGGAVSVESAPGAGSTFTIQLPRLPPERDAEPWPRRA